MTTERHPIPSIGIPDALRSTVSRIWGTEGEAWLDALPGLVLRLCERWHLRPDSLETPDGLSVAYVAFVQSDRLGEAVLKVGFPHHEMRTGMRALARLAGPCMCRVHEGDPDALAVLMERVRPGDPLGDEPDFETRVRVAAGVVRDLPVPTVDGDAAVFPSFSGLFAASLARARSLDDRPADLARHLDFAESLHESLHDGSRPLCLLHGDLRHENLLRSSGGFHLAVDPHGWVGERVLDAGRYFQHEWARQDPSYVEKRMARMVETFARVLGVRAGDIAASCHLNSARTACWALEKRERRVHLEDNLVRMRWLEGAFL
jgi:streptomycin 6-kinase